MPFYREELNFQENTQHHPCVCVVDQCMCTLHLTYIPGKLFKYTSFFLSLIFILKY